MCMTNLDANDGLDSSVSPVPTFGRGLTVRQRRYASEMALHQDSARACRAAWGKSGPEFLARVESNVKIRAFIAELRNRCGVVSSTGSYTRDAYVADLEACRVGAMLKDDYKVALSCVRAKAKAYGVDVCVDRVGSGLSNGGLIPLSDLSTAQLLAIVRMSEDRDILTIDCESSAISRPLEGDDDVASGRKGRGGSVDAVGVGESRVDVDAGVQEVAGGESGVGDSQYVFGCAYPRVGVEPYPGEAGEAD